MLFKQQIIFGQKLTILTPQPHRPPYMNRFLNTALKNTYISLQDTKISSTSFISFNCMANLMACGNCLNLRYNSTAVFISVMFSGSGTYGTQLKKKKIES